MKCILSVKGLKREMWGCSSECFVTRSTTSLLRVSPVVIALRLQQVPTLYYSPLHYARGLPEN